MIGRHRHAPIGRDRQAGDGDTRPEVAERLPTVALVGRPNVGKSTFLARASHRFVETSNAPGTTVHRRASADRWPVAGPPGSSTCPGPAR